MIKYCFIIDEEKGLVQLGAGCSDEYYEEIGMQQRDVDQSDIDNQWYLAEKCPHKTPQQLLEEARQIKYQENEQIRDTYLVSGVTYKQVLFDSDIEQKLNISIQVGLMNDTDTVEWTGMDGITKLTCTKQDLLTIGNLLLIMTSYVWAERNPEIKILIRDAKSIEELNNIEITYDPIQV